MEIPKFHYIHKVHLYQEKSEIIDKGKIMEFVPTKLLTAGSLVRVQQGEPKVGVDGGEGTPVPIPNTAVKLICAEDTWLEAARENR